MRHALLLVALSFLVIAGNAQSNDNIQVITDADSMRFIVDGQETAIATADMANYYFAQGIEAATSGDFAKAESKFRIAAMYSPDNAQILYNLGLTQYFLEKYSVALVTFDSAMQFDSTNKDLYNQRALCNAILGNFEKAETDFITMLQFDPQFAAGNYNYGILLMQKGDDAGACKYFQKAEELGYENAPFAITNFCTN